MTQIPYRISDKTITVVIDGKVETVQRSAMNATDLIEALSAEVHDVDHIRALSSVRNYVTAISQGRVELREGVITVAGTALSGYMVDRILRHHKEGVNVKPMLAYLDLIYNHPLPGIKEDLFKWTEVGDMPFTSEGHIIAYKKVRADYRSYHQSPDGTHLLHTIGGEVSMPPEQVNTNRHQTCSTGLHFCSYSYLKEYYGSKGRILILAIHPHDILAIPTDYNQTKGRASKYQIIGELPLEEAGKFFQRKLVVDKFQTYQGLVDPKETTTKEPVRVKAKAPTKASVPAVPAAVKKVTKDSDLDDFMITHKALANPISYREILANVNELGQTGAAKKYGVARTTMQEWLKKINAAMAA